MSSLSLAFSESAVRPGDSRALTPARVLRPSRDTGGTLKSKEAASARPVVPTLQADRAVIAINVAQVQPFGYVVGILRALPQPHDLRLPTLKPADGSVVPGLGVGGIGLLSREPVGPFLGLGGGLAAEGRARCTVSFRRPRDAEAFGQG